jgi:hypothetical protein
MLFVLEPSALNGQALALSNSRQLHAGLLNSLAVDGLQLIVLSVSASSTDASSTRVRPRRTLTRDNPLHGQWLERIALRKRQPTLQE